MTWDAYHRREDALRAVIDEANTRLDGVLPIDAALLDVFGDEVHLVGALQQRWHTRLSGAIEKALDEQPWDPQAAVLTAWRRTRSELPGVRLVLDTCAAHPTSEEMARTLRRARRQEQALLVA